MVKISLGLKTETIELPSFPGSKVEIKTNALTSELRALNKKYPGVAENPNGEQSEKFGAEFMEMMIVSWNFTDDDDKALPVEEKYLNQLPIKDFKFLSEKIRENVDGLVGEEKKKG